MSESQDKFDTILSSLEADAKTAIDAKTAETAENEKLKAQIAAGPDLSSETSRLQALDAELKGAQPSSSGPTDPFPVAASDTTVLPVSKVTSVDPNAPEPGIPLVTSGTLKP